MPTKKTRRAAAIRGWETRRKNLGLSIKEAAAKKKAPAKKAKTGGIFLKTPIIKKWHPAGESSLNQIYYSGLEFAFANTAGEQCHPFAFCKDYLQDAIWATINKKPTGIYGFRYDPKTNPPLDMVSTRMALRLKGKSGFKEMCIQSQKFMHKVEKDLGYTPSSLYYGGESSDSPVYVFTSDVRWMFSPVLISFYSLLLRVGMTYEGGDWQKHFSEGKKLGTNDVRYTAKASKALSKIVIKNPEKLFAPTLEGNYPPTTTVYGLHDNSGIVSFATDNINSDVKKNWKKA